MKIIKNYKSFVNENKINELFLLGGELDNNLSDDELIKLYKKIQKELKDGNDTDFQKNLLSLYKKEMKKRKLKINESSLISSNINLENDFKIMGEFEGEIDIYDSSNDIGEAQYLLSNFIEAFDKNEYKFWIEDKNGNKINVEPDDVNNADVVKENNDFGRNTEITKEMSDEFIKNSNSLKPSGVKIELDDDDAIGAIKIDSDKPFFNKYKLRDGRVIEVDINHNYYLIEEKLSNKLNETGEWDRDIDWQYVKDNPDEIERNEFASMIKGLELLLDEVKDYLPEGFPFEIVDIKGFDIYQGAYATVKINGLNYKVWNIDTDIIWIENYKYDNSSDEKSNAGLQGFPEEVADKIVETEIL